MRPGGRALWAAAQAVRQAARTAEGEVEVVVVRGLRAVQEVQEEFRLGLAQVVLLSAEAGAALAQETEHRALMAGTEATDK